VFTHVTPGKKALSRSVLRVGNRIFGVFVSVLHPSASLTSIIIPGRQEGPYHSSLIEYLLLRNEKGEGRRKDVLCEGRKGTSCGPSPEYSSAFPIVAYSLQNFATPSIM
jgi:hypothetical protein